MVAACLRADDKLWLFQRFYRMHEQCRKLGGRHETRLDKT